MRLIETLNEKPLTMVEIKQKLEDIEKRDSALNFRAKKAKEYLDQFVTMKPADAVKIREKLVKLEIPRLRDRHITKIIDMNPKDIDSLKMILSGETLTLKPEEMNKIFETTNEK